MQKEKTPAKGWSASGGKDPSENPESPDNLSVEQLKEKYLKELEKVSSLSREDARKIMLKELEQEILNEKASRLAEAEEQMQKLLLLDIEREQLTEALKVWVGAEGPVEYNGMMAAFSMVNRFEWPMAPLLDVLKVYQIDVGVQIEIEHGTGGGCAPRRSGHARRE